MEEIVSLGDFMNIVRKRWLQILIWALGFLALAGVYTFFFTTPLYQSTSKIVVNQTQNSSQAITNMDIQTNLNLIETYQSIIQEPIILEDVVSENKTGLTISELRNKITIRTEQNSLVFGIIITDENPYEAADLANKVAASFESKIGDILDVQSVTILSEATPNLSQVSPNTTLNLLIGLLAGLALGVLISYIVESTNKTVRDEKFIEQLGWTHLGSVLEMSQSEIDNTRIANARKTRISEKTVLRRRVL